MNTIRVGGRLLVLEEELAARNLISLTVKHQGWTADFADDVAAATMLLEKSASRYAAVVVGQAAQNCPSAADTFIQNIRAAHPGLGIILITSPGALRLPPGSGDEVVEKPLNGEKLRAAVRQCLARHTHAAVVSEAPHSGAEFCEPSSVWRNEMQALIKHVSVSDIPVLVQGETGSGKEVLARHIHASSPRSRKPFLKVNCAALPSELIESELFGYERGAFTGAFKTTPGKFEMADGGSILLDEIGDMDFKLQAKLLQVLQDCEFIRLGSSEPRRVDVRVIAATHCDLEQAIAERRFREDLYYRLNIITIHVPPLRDRRSEILPLSYHFMRKHATQASPAMELPQTLRDALLSHDWPGNIRELENVIRRLLVIRKPDYIADDIRNRARRRQSAPGAVEQPVAAPALKAPPEQRDSNPRTPASPLQMPPTVLAINSSKHDDLNGTVENRNGSNAVPQPIRSHGMGNWSVLDRVDQARREAETDAILQALGSTLWNRKRAAELLNIDYKALLYKMKKLGIVERAAKVAI